MLVDTTDDAYTLNLISEYPVLALRDRVLFPGVEQTYHVGRPESVAMLDALQTEPLAHIVVMPQLLSETEQPGPTDLSPMGSIACIQSMHVTDTDEKTSPRVLLVALRGEARVKLSGVTQTTPFLRGRFERLQEESKSTSPALVAELRELWKIVMHSKHVDHAITKQIEQTCDAVVLVGLVTTYTDGITFAEQRAVLETPDVNEQLTMLVALIHKRAAETELKAAIRKRVKSGMEASQREYYLREQLRAIQSELGDDESKSQLSIIRDRLSELALPEPVRTLVQRTQAQMELQSESAAEYIVGLKLLQHIAALPWAPHTTPSPDVATVRAMLDGLHYGADEVADWIVEELAIRNLTEHSGQTLCLVGPPGVGKTTLAQAIARALSRPIQTISLAGTYDAAIIRGHRRVYTGSEPGMLASALQAAGMLAPVILLDEIDKISDQSNRGSIGTALLQALDPSLNRHYRDEYLGFTIDLSQVLFIATANQVDDIYPPLRSRMRVLKFWGYSADEKLVIARDYICSRMIESHGLSGRVSIDTGALEQLIERYTQEPGVRDLSRLIERICRRSAALLAQSNISLKSLNITAASIDSFLGSPTVPPSMGVPKARIGRVGTLFVGDSGTSVRAIDSICFPGRGKLVISGFYPDVVKERVQVALSVVRHRAESLGFDAATLHNSDIHVHIDSDLASRDVLNVDLAIYLSLVSALTGQAAPQRCAVIGSIDLHGDVGGCEEFVARMAAGQRQRLDLVMIPASHQAEVARLPNRILNGLRVQMVASVDEAVTMLFGSKPPERNVSRSNHE